MTHDTFLQAFANVQKIGSVEELLTHHSQRYSFQINSRERAKSTIEKLNEKLHIDWKGLRVLDVGCAYGAFTIELAKLGAKSVGIELSEKWLNLATINAENEVEVPFILCDASHRRACRKLAAYGPFDVVFVNDVFEHIYDTPSLLENLRILMAPKGLLYFKVPNGKSTRHVLLEGHKRKFGISLLAPDYWTKFVEAPFQIYYRRWEYFNALFKEYHFHNLQILNENHDDNHEHTKKHILRDIHKIKQSLKLANFENVDQFKVVRNACEYYFEEVEEDLITLSWSELFFKYRINFWEGIIHAPEKERAVLE
jgi:2-polyprenyl-3-methyl-5-hydroxy-6-metoxy-1,4-benzoquinol methylase